MPLRLMQIYVPRGENDAIEELLAEKEIIGHWKDTETEQVILNLLLPAEATEPIMDRFEQLYSGAPGFHAILLSVEATLPRQESEDKPDETEESEENSNNRADRISREELREKVHESLGVSRVFLAMTILSAVVAAIGLIRDDVAVIIGAMVIAPLLGPNVALALGTTLGDFDLIRRALIRSKSPSVVPSANATLGISI